MPVYFILILSGMALGLLTLAVDLAVYLATPIDGRLSGGRYDTHRHDWTFPALLVAVLIGGIGVVWAIIALLGWLFAGLVGAW